MTVSSTTNRVAYSGSGTAGPFATPPFSAVADLKVIHTDSDGVDTTLALTSGYTVAGGGGGAAGNLTLVSPSTLAVGAVLTIINDPSPTQTGVDLNDGDSFPADTVEQQGLDRITFIIQRALSRIDRCVQIPDSQADPSSPYTVALTVANALKYLRVSATGEIELVTNVSGLDVSGTLAENSLAMGDGAGGVAWNTLAQLVAAILADATILEDLKDGILADFDAADAAAMVADINAAAAALESLKDGIFADVDSSDITLLKQAVDADHVIALLGAASDDAEDFGSFTGSTIPDSSTAKEALQALETAVENAAPLALGSATSIGTGNNVNIAVSTSGVNRIYILIEDLSASTTSTIDLQLGDSGGVEVTGYEGSNNVATFSASFEITSDGGGGANYHGWVELIRDSSGSNKWHMKSQLSRTDGASFANLVGEGFKELSGELTTLYFSTSAGVFDGGGTITVHTE